MTAQVLPGEVLEQILACVPFPERITAAVVCRTWRRYLSQRNLPLWQAACIEDHGEWNCQLDQRLQLFLPLQRWLQCHGSRLLQLQCCTSFSSREGCQGRVEDGLLAAFLTALAAAAPSLQALRLDAWAGWNLVNSCMVGVASMGSTLRQLAILGLQHVSDDSLVAALMQLPRLQDLALMFRNEEDVHSTALDIDENDPPDFMRLLDHVAVHCTALRTLAIGHLPCHGTHAPGAETLLDGQPLPSSMSRLSALSSLLLRNVGWEYAPLGVPHLPQLQRLSLRGDYRESSHAEPDFRHQLSAFTGLEALQATLPEWPGRLPPGLTQLVWVPLGVTPEEAHLRTEGCATFLRTHLPPLRALRHLALHGLHEIGLSLLQEVGATAGALPQLISLHLVDCRIRGLPYEICGLSRLQLLNLADNPMLADDGFRLLGYTPLNKLASCKQLDLRCGAQRFPFTNRAALSAIAGMPALEQLALSCIDAHQAAGTPQRLALLAERRAPGLPPIRVVADMPESDCWSTVDVELPFDEVNGMLGVQLDRSIVREIPFTW